MLSLILVIFKIDFDKSIDVSFIMYKNIILIGVLLFLSNCNQYSNINQHNLNNISSLNYQEKPFEIKISSVSEPIPGAIPSKGRPPGNEAIGIFPKLG